jgi:probable HAF family extracellular repeat protein
MDIKGRSGKRVIASQRDSFTAQSNQTTNRKPWKSLATVAFGLFLSVPGLTQAQYSFTTIDVPKATATAANGNSTHEIAGEFDDSGGITHGFVLNKGVFTQINVPNVANTLINGINALGQLAGTWFDDPAMPHAFFYNNGSFTTLNPPGSIRSQGGFINAKGQVVGTYRDQNQKRHGFIWRNGIFTKPFNAPNDDPVLGTVALGINDHGEVVGDYVVFNDPAG